MIRIYKDNDVKQVTIGVYKQLYEPLGYKTVIDAPEIKAEDIKEEKVVQPIEEEKKSEQTIKSSKNKKRKGD